MDGLLAELCVWKDLVLTDEQVLALALGIHPRLIRPDKLAHYWDLLASSLTDAIGGKVLSNTGTTMDTDHPPQTISWPPAPIHVPAIDSGFGLTPAVVDVVPMRARVEPYPIARWIINPFDRIPDPWKPGVIAIHKDGISKVEFTVAGQGFSGPTPIVVTDPTYNEQTGVWDFHPTISHSQFSSNGVITIEAKVFPDNAFGMNRDKNTEGGGLGLDQLSFVVNQDGTLRQTVAYVSTTGNDGTGALNDRSKPYLNPHAAFTAANTADGDCDGLLVRLEAGDYDFGGGVTVTTANEWATLMPAPGVSQADVRITSVNASPNSPKTLRLKVKDLFAVGDQRLRPWTGAGYAFCVERCVLNGDNRTGVVHPIKSISSIDKVYLIDTEVFNVANGAADVDLLRGVDIHGCNNDATRNCFNVVNANIEDITPEGTGNHCDGFQINSSTPYNIIWYNVRMTRMEQSFVQMTTTVPIRGLAMINMYGVQIPSPNVTGTVVFQQSVDHLCMWNCSFRTVAGQKSRAEMRDESENPGAPIYFSNVSIRANHFAHFVYHSSLSAIATNADRNFEAKTGYDRNNIYDNIDGPIAGDLLWGTNLTQGDPKLTTDGFPGVGSSLLNTVAANLVPEDAGGNERATPGEAGAYEQSLEGNLNMAVVNVTPFPFNDFFAMVVDVTPYGISGPPVPPRDEGMLVGGMLPMAGGVG
jgi:hypothetical protein